jgi:hypothetical protein
MTPTRRSARRPLLPVGAVLIGAVLSACGGGGHGGGAHLAVDVPDRRDTAAAVAAGSWHRLPPSPVGSPLGPLLTWDGHELLQVGGLVGVRTRSDGSVTGGSMVTDAVAFTPDDGHWRRLDPAPFPVTAGQAGTVWTGSRLVLFSRTDAALLDPSSGRWHRIAAPPLTVTDPVRTDAPTAVWNGRRVVVAEVLQQADGTETTEAAGYDPAADRWTRLDPPSTAGHDQRAAPIVATPDGVVLFSLWSHSVTRAIRGGTMVSGTSGVDVRRLGADGRWTTLAASWPQDKTVSSPLLTAVGVIVPAGQIWCGDCSHPAPFGERGYLADPRSLQGRRMSQGPLDDTDPEAVWTGKALVTLAQAGISGAGVSIGRGDLATWDPGTDRWARAARSPGGMDYRTVAVWGAHRLFAVDATGRPVSFDPSVPAPAVSARASGGLLPGS